MYTHNTYTLLANQPTNSTLLTEQYVKKCTVNIKNIILNY